MKVVIITCYKQPDYIRAQTLRAAAAACPGVETIVIKNSSKGFARYIEVLGKLVVVRLKHRPDAYLLTFRGYEVLPFCALLTWPKALIYDEFINPLEWLQEPRKERWVRLVPQFVLRWFYPALLHRCAWVLADTEAHARYSQDLNRVTGVSYSAIPVSTDETLFKPARSKHAGEKCGANSKKFRVFYYGNMLPLHGLGYVLAAAVRLRTLPIEFLIIGGDKHTQTAVHKAQSEGGQIIYRSWAPFATLPRLIREADLCLGGPFGNTTQAQYVITGKTYQFMACGVPTVIGKSKVTHAFRDKVNCLIVPQGEAGALTQAITWAYKHPQQLQAIGNQGHKLYEKDFSLRVVTQKLQTILRPQT